MPVGGLATDDGRLGRRAAPVCSQPGVRHRPDLPSAFRVRTPGRPAGCLALLRQGHLVHRRRAAAINWLQSADAGGDGGSVSAASLLPLTRGRLSGFFPVLPVWPVWPVSPDPVLTSAHCAAPPHALGTRADRVATL